jgi:hypothetical protein
MKDTLQARLLKDQDIQETNGEFIILMIKTVINIPIVLIFDIAGLLTRIVRFLSPLFYGHYLSFINIQMYLNITLCCMLIYM